MFVHSLCPLSVRPLPSAALPFFRCPCPAAPSFLLPLCPACLSFGHVSRCVARCFGRRPLSFLSAGRALCFVRLLCARGVLSCCVPSPSAAPRPTRSCARSCGALPSRVRCGFVLRGCVPPSSPSGPPSALCRLLPCCSALAFHSARALRRPRSFPVGPLAPTHPGGDRLLFWLRSPSLGSTSVFAKSEVPT